MLRALVVPGTHPPGKSKHHVCTFVSSRLEGPAACAPALPGCPDLPFPRESSPCPPHSQIEDHEGSRSQAALGDLVGDWGLNKESRAPLPEAGADW